MSVKDESADPSAENSASSPEPTENEEPTTLQAFTASILKNQSSLDLLSAYRVKDEPLDTDSDEDDDNGSDVVIGPMPQEDEDPIEDDKTRKFGHTVKGELTLDDLPPVEKLQIEVARDRLRNVGAIHSFVDRLVVVESIEGCPVLNLDSVLFLEDGRPIGQIFDVIGRVKQPYYVIRFNNPQEIADEHLEKGVQVFYADGMDVLTMFVFEQQIREMMMMKGSDASWEHDLEPPAHELAYSDDEAERAAKQERRAKRALNGRPVGQAEADGVDGGGDRAAEGSSAANEDKNAAPNRNRRRGRPEAAGSASNRNGRPGHPGAYGNGRGGGMNHGYRYQGQHPRFAHGQAPAANPGNYQMMCGPYAMAPPGYNPWALDRPQLVPVYAAPPGYVATPPGGASGFPIGYAPAPFLNPAFGAVPPPQQPMFMAEQGQLMRQNARAPLRYPDSQR